MADAPTSTGRLLVGLAKGIGAEVTFSDVDRRARKGSSHHAKGVLRINDSRFTWFTKVRANGATATRLHFTDVKLPNGVELFVYSSMGEAFGPYTGKGVNGNGDFWSNTVMGPEVRVQLQYRGEQIDRVLAATRLKIAEVVHQGPNFELAKHLRPELFEQPGFGSKAFCSFNASCVQNASCSSLPGSVQSARDAVAHYSFVSGGSSFICSGGLLNDTDTSSFIPYFLTANHCVSSSGEVSSIEAFFQFSTPCGGACFNPNGAVPRVLGATLLAGASSSDFTLARLNQSAPAGSFFIGWSPTPVAFSNGTQLNRLSHPRGAPQAFSQQQVTTGGVSCGSLPRGNFIYSKDTFGATEGGSSGSPILNTSGQVVGQLFGACGTNLGNVCDSQNNSTVDGAFASYFSQVDQFLDPGTSPPQNSCQGRCGGQAPGGCWCDDQCTGFGDCCSDFNQVCASPNSCVGNCGGQAPGGCWCDAQCEGFGDCCSNKVTICGNN
ncbi:MAG: trypsin-like peptidase domain-containing protein [Thermoanaerobaculia bacterium]|nr:trypsin-like peptidase domain-containing protein [Thermoanaerobaculia bacterium]